MTTDTTTAHPLVIRYEPADGVTLEGSTRGDGVYDVVRTLGLNWRGLRDGSGGLYIRGSRDKDIARLRHAIDRTRDALEQAAAGRWTVAVEVADGDGFRPAAERRADADERADGRADMLADRAGRRFGEAAAQDDLNRQRAGRMTDEPIKIGHHSENRHRRAVEQLRAGSTKAGELRAAGAYAAERARGVEANAAHRSDPRAIMRRIELLETQRRGYARELAGYVRESRNGAGVVVYRDEFPAATGQRADDLRRWDARDAEEIEHLRGLLADMDAAGTFSAWGPEHFQTGDLVRVLGSWLPVRRVNRKSVSVPGGYGMAGNDATWNATATWDKVEGRRRDGLQLDTPNGEPWPVELAKRVARWSSVHWGRRAHHYPHGSEEERAARHALYAMRIVHGLDLGAGDAQVTAIRDSITGTDDVRALVSTYLTVFDRLQAGELVPAIRESVTPITGDPAWTLPADVEPVDRHPQDLRPGDLVAGAWDTAGLRGGRATTLHRGFCGPVEHVGDVRDYGELGRWVMVTLTTGDARDFSVTRWIAVHPADGGDPAETVEPAPDGGPVDAEPAPAPAETAADAPTDAPTDTDGDDDADPWGDVLDGDGDGFQPGDAVTVAGWSAGTCEVAGTDDAGRVLVDLGGEISHVPADRVEPAAPRVDHVELTGSAHADGAHVILAQLATDLTRDGDTDPDKIRAVWRLARAVVSDDPETAVSAGEAQFRLGESGTLYPRGPRVEQAARRFAELLAPVLGDLEPGHTVRSRMTVGPRVVTADVVADTVDRLHCGCQRVRATRADGRGVELLGGCSFHPAEMEPLVADTPAAKWRLIHSCSTGSARARGRWDRMLSAMREVLDLTPDADLPAITAAQKADGRDTEQRAAAYLEAYARRLDTADTDPVDRIALPFTTLALVSPNTMPATAAWCVERGHPWVTYNPWLSRSWCRCGARQADGHQPADFRALHEEHHTCDYDDPAPCRCYLDAQEREYPGSVSKQTGR